LANARVDGRVVRGDDAPPPPPPEVADRAKKKLHSLWTPKNSDHRSVVLGQLERMALATKDTQQRELPRVALPKERLVRQPDQRAYAATLLQCPHTHSIYENPPEYRPRGAAVFPHIAACGARFVPRPYTLHRPCADTTSGLGEARWQLGATVEHHLADGSLARGQARFLSKTVSRPSAAPVRRSAAPV
jgi:hypothetical protein